MKTLLAGLELLLRCSSTQPKINNPRITAAPRTEPTTIPAISPPVNPALCDLLVVSVGLDVGEVVGVDVEDEENRGAMDDVAMTGKTTPEHLVSVFEKTQQESVAFGELDAQYPQSPLILSAKPQLVGSFVTPSMQVPVSELAGRAQFVKSARICVNAFGPAEPHTSLAVMSSSLSAY